ncbi:toxin ParE1/3/4 [Bathymodiolus platifrons methanotrophic gill symbiont]|uniref:hypothetical protein n=1 Tax=Bathymodiolus platifrons methanotrophic gill symbiont TaxID=113268 RepID=UPI00142D1E7F|nr:hypothetical protein [Bathymodiolus platifrons methanotrophic gill symbiont]GFO76958.1 toxin ParE1/3/4 [Bathymodiolus platifrons methanotrophic gill symbiont]
MENYKLSKEAEKDLIRIHQYGVIKYGEALADQHYFALPVFIGLQDKKLISGKNK